MNIIIVGAGAVGSAICQRLAEEKHNITIIDGDELAVTEISNKCDVIGIVGNGASVPLLKKAEAEKADLIIAVTGSDELNILCCASAKRLGTTHKIARIRNPEYAELTSYMRKDSTLSMTINPELAVAKEIYRTLRFPSAAKVEVFAHGRAELAEYVVPQGSQIAGLTLNELRSKLGISFLVCAVLRDAKAHIPTGSFVIEEGDVLGLTAQEEELTRFFKLIGAYKKPVRSVLISGGGRTTYYLEALLRRSKISSTVIESDKKKCHELVESFDCTVICDDETDHDVLLEAGVDKTDAFIALSDSDEENAIVSMYASSAGAAKVITKINSMPYIEIFKKLGLQSLISPKISTTAYILRYVRALSGAKGSDIESLHRLMDDKIEAMEFIIKEDISGITNIPLKKLKLRNGIIIACIVRGDRLTVPTGDDVIMAGDTVLTVSANMRINGIKEILL